MLSVSERVLIVAALPPSATSGSVAVEVVPGGGRLTPLPRWAAFSLARTRAASASRSEAASLAVMVAMDSGDCCGAGSTPLQPDRGKGRRELTRFGERPGDGAGDGAAPCGGGGGGRRTSALALALALLFAPVDFDEVADVAEAARAGFF